MERIFRSISLFPWYSPLDLVEGNTDVSYDRIATVRDRSDLVFKVTSDV